MTCLVFTQTEYGTNISLSGLQTWIVKMSIPYFDSFFQNCPTLQDTEAALDTLTWCIMLDEEEVIGELKAQIKFMVRWLLWSVEFERRKNLEES